MRRPGFVRVVLALACCIGAAPYAQAQWAVSAAEGEPTLPSFFDKRRLPNLTIPPASPAASTEDEETRRKAEELSKKFSAPETGLREAPVEDQARGLGSAIGTATGQAPAQSVAPVSDESIRRELEATRRRAIQAEESARKERADRAAFEAESRKAMEQAATAVAKAQEEAKKAAKRAAEAEKRAQSQQPQKNLGFKPPAAPTQSAAQQPIPRPAPADTRTYDDRRAQGLFGLGVGRR